MTAIKAHLSAAELEERHETAAEPIAQSHFHAVWLLSKGYDIDEVGEILSFSTRWVRSLIKRYNEGGPDRLGDQRIHNLRASLSSLMASSVQGLAFFEPNLTCIELEISQIGPYYVDHVLRIASLH